MPYLFRKTRFRDACDKLLLSNSQTEAYEYLLEFDPSLNIPDTWITQRDLVCINILREEINTVSLYRG
jgi:hypothetical protein